MGPNPSSPGLLTDYKGVLTTNIKLSANLVQGTLTGATTNYLQAYATVGTTTQLVNQPITGGTIIAAVSPTPDANGFTIHGTMQMLLSISLNSIRDSAPFDKFDDYPGLREELIRAGGDGKSYTDDFSFSVY